ncbi:type II methionyl aminopeptidase [Methanobrevibacter filiformis]|uniref:Methionine aminopeptidase n=1 Tax=Methanobrevibacter filiformis TaxID=55758 RepID=A0A166CFV2_9EURY|nr:type II methionyl aminopeptidase [Methanobrevibacter filiformis]KZX14461.1 methionine aminopeptidase 1 [Methanobrevibacter filiformis]
MDEYYKSGKIVSKVRDKATKIIKDGLAIVELIEYVENEIKKEGAGIAFPVNVSINEITAHYTSPLNDTNTIKTGDLVKLDLGAEIDGYIADSAITIMAPGDNLEEKFSEDTIEKNNNLIEASATGLEAAISTVKADVEVGQIGKAVEEAINSFGFKPIINLAGHSLEQWNLHSGLSIPNIDDHSTKKIKEGDVLAIEPFATDGVGWVDDTKSINIYKLIADKPFRMQHTQKVLNEIKSEYSSLPFASRWLTEKFNVNRLNSSLRQLSNSMAVYPYPALKEKTNAWVSQKEHTVIVEKDSCIITTK